MGEGGTGPLPPPVSSHCPQSSPATASPSADGLRWTMGPGHQGLRFQETRGEGLSPQEPVFRLRNCSPGVLALPLPGDRYKHRDWGAPYGWSASFSPLDRAEDFLKHKRILSPTSTHPHSIFLKLFHPRVKSSAHSLPSSMLQLLKLWQSWDETPLPPGL